MSTSDKEFCKHCGRQLEFRQTKDYTYDRLTGKKLGESLLCCPKFTTNPLLAMFKGFHDAYRYREGQMGRSRLRWR